MNEWMIKKNKQMNKIPLELIEFSLMHFAQSLTSVQRA